jgi:hypothetical protein
MTNRIRAVLRQFFPAAIDAFDRGGKHRLDSAACRMILSAASTPAAARRLTLTQLRSLLRRAGRSRGIDAEAASLQKILRSTRLQQPSRIEDAMGSQLRCLLDQLDAICSAVDQLTAAVEEPDRCRRGALRRAPPSADLRLVPRCRCTDRCPTASRDRR